MLKEELTRCFVVLAFFLFTFASLPVAHRPTKAQELQKLLVTVVDENGLAVTSARIILIHVDSQAVYKGETDYVGRHEFTGLRPGLYNLRVEKEGFYAGILNDVRVGEADTLELTLNHQQEFAEVMDVVYSSPAIDPTKTAISEGLSGQDIINIPYPTTRDFRNVLPFIPGVVQAPSGQVHLNGSAAYQNFNQLDGFNITHPTSGLLELKISVDALRSIEVLSSRYSAEYGKGSGGVLSLATGMGDDRYRFLATNFVPSLQARKGINLDNWTPRATFSGPLRKKKAWFFDAADAEYNQTIVEELPSGADRIRALRLGNLTKLQVNLNQANILTAGLLVNYFNVDHAGLSRFAQLETTRDVTKKAYLLTLKQQSYFSNGTLVEVGFAVNQFRTEDRPLGNLPFVISPEGVSGNYFRTSEGLARRLQWIASLILPPIKWRGRHEVRVGTDINRITHEQSSEQRPITILREGKTLSRRITFDEIIRFGKNNTEASGYAQDRWSLSNGSVLELGLRFDWDRIVGRALVSPRMAFSRVLTADGNTKMAAGIGLVYDATNLDLITRPSAGRRFDSFYALDGETLERGPVESSFQVSERDLKSPRFLNWSLGVDRKLPASIYLRAEYLQKRGSNGFAFVNRSANQLINRFELSNVRRDRYDSLQVTLHRAFKGAYAIMASYTRSAARSNALFEFGLDNPLLSRQAGGRLSWDTPNRFVSWGWLPLVKRFDLGYSMEWRDGYPFSLVNEDQQFVGQPNSKRFPSYFSLNLHAERRFRVMGYQWALRAGFNNLTNRNNPTEVNNNVDSPEFLTFGGSQDRAFIARIRFLGRK